MITQQMSRDTAIIIKENILFSNLRCIKILNTNDDFTAAIRSAIKTVSGPR
jgi:hypothetical protein